MIGSIIPPISSPLLFPWITHPPNTHTQPHTLKHTTTHIQTYTRCLTHSNTQSNALKHTNIHIQTQTHNHMYSHTHTHTCSLTLPDQAASSSLHLHTLIQSSLPLQAPLLCPSHSLSEAHTSSGTNLSGWLTSFGGGISELLFPKCKCNGFVQTFALLCPFRKTCKFLPCTLVLTCVCVCVCVCACVCVCTTITRALTNTNHATSLSAHLGAVSRAEYQQIHLEMLKNVKETARAVS